MKYDWKKTAKKGAMIVGMGAALGAVQAAMNFLGSSNIPIEYTAWSTFGISALRMLENYLKHQK